MEIDGIAIGAFYPLAELPARMNLPGRRPGKRISVRTLERWRLQGLRGGTVRLRVASVGGTYVTCDQWVADFLRVLNGTSESASLVHTPTMRTPGQRQRDSQDARAQLEARQAAR
jgi:hypothetical protein